MCVGKGVSLFLEIAIVNSVWHFSSLATFARHLPFNLLKKGKYAMKKVNNCDYLMLKINDKFNSV